MASPGAKVIVVGAGRWGLNHIRTANELGVLAGVVDQKQDALERAQEMLGEESKVTLHVGLNEALSAHPTACVVVATPPSSHFFVARKAIGAKRHLFVEKPLCDSVAQAEQLVALAEKSGIILMVDHLLQYAGPQKALLQLLGSGFVGDVTRVKMSRMNFGTVRTQENVLWSFTPHDVSILLSICNNQLPQSVSCVGQKVVTCGIDDYIDMTIKFEDGVQAQIEASWLHPEKERRLIVYGTAGALILNEAMPDAKAPKLQGFKWSAKRKKDGSAVVIEKRKEDLTGRASHPGQLESNGVPSGDKPPLQEALEHFLACQKEKTVPRTDGNEGLRVLKVLSAAEESLTKDGAPVLLDTGSQGAKIFVHSTAVVDSGAHIGIGTKIWHFSHIMSGARLGPVCNIGQNVYIGGRAVLGRNVKVQNNVSIYDAVLIDNDVFLGPSCVLTNVKTPRSHVNRKHAFTQTKIGRGATVGANATIVCGVDLGAYCFIGAGAVVTKDVPAHAMVYGNPATLQGWVSTIGTKLTQIAEIGESAKVLQCEESKEVYTLYEKGEDGSGKPCLILSSESQ